MSEQRADDPVTEEDLDPATEVVENVSSTLAAKPVGDTYLSAGQPKVDIKVDVWAVSITLLVDILIGIGLAFLAVPLVGAFGFLVLILLEVAIVSEVKKKVRERIHRELISSDVKDSLDDAGLMTYAGEGLAEDISREIILKANDPNISLDPGNTKGRNRFRDQFWQMIFVSCGMCKVLIRK